MAFIKYNPNPAGAEVGDCTVRAIAIAQSDTWEKVFIALCVQAMMMADMPSSNNVWRAYLLDHGWNCHQIPDFFPFAYTVQDFCRDHPQGTYILGTGTHVVCCRDGDYIDAWDSGNKTPIFYFDKEE